jgi:hypothetical protein
MAKAKESKPKQIEQRTISRLLRCELTTDELLAAGKRLAEKSTEMAELEADKKRINDDFKAKISAIEAEVGTLVSRVTTGYEHRNVECVELYDNPERGRKTITRKDTMQRVAVEDMTFNDQQRELALESEAA